MLEDKNAPNGNVLAGPWGDQLDLPEGDDVVHIDEAPDVVDLSKARVDAGLEQTAGLVRTISSATTLASSLGVERVDIEEGLDTQIFMLSQTIRELKNFKVSESQKASIQNTIDSIFKTLAELCVGKTRGHLEIYEGLIPEYQGYLQTKYPLEVEAEEISLQNILESMGIIIPDLRTLAGELHDSLWSSEWGEKQELRAEVLQIVYPDGQPENVPEWRFWSSLEQYMPEFSKLLEEEDPRSISRGYVNRSQEPVLTLMISPAATQVKEEGVDESAIYKALDVMAYAHNVSSEGRDCLKNCLDFELGKHELTKQEEARAIRYSDKMHIVDSLFVTAENPLIPLNTELVYTLHSGFMYGLKPEWKKLEMDDCYHDDPEALKIAISDIVATVFAKFELRVQVEYLGLDAEADNVFAIALVKKQITEALFDALWSEIEDKKVAA